MKAPEDKTLCQEIMQGYWSRSEIGAANSLMKTGLSRPEAVKKWRWFISSGLIIPTQQKDEHYYLNPCN